MNRLSFLLFLLIGSVYGCGFESQTPWYEDRIDAKYQQVDRIGFPHLDEIFYGATVLSAIRAGDVSTDEEELAPQMASALLELRESVSTVSGFVNVRDDAKSVEEVADLWTPNAIFIDINEPILLEGGNGRPIEGEDSFDFMISTALGRFLEDQIAAINRGLLNRFPYLPAPRGLNYKEDPAGSEEDPAEEGCPEC